MLTEGSTSSSAEAFFHGEVRRRRHRAGQAFEFAKLVVRGLAEKMLHARSERTDVHFFGWLGRPTGRKPRSFIALRAPTYASDHGLSLEQRACGRCPDGAVRWNYVADKDRRPLPETQKRAHFASS